MTVVAGLLDVAVFLLVTAKVGSYLWGFGWLARGGGARLRKEYMWRYRRHEVPTREDERNAGRPPALRFVGHNVPGRVLGVAITAPGIVIIAAVATLPVASRAPAWSALLVASAIAILIFVMCASALIARAVLGPLDRLNPDLGVGRFDQGIDGVLYPPSDPTEDNPYGRYTLVLIASLMIGFTTAYANTSAAAPGAFMGGSSADPVRWLYFTSTFAATLRASDLAPIANIGRLLVCGQLVSAVLIASILVSGLLPAKMPVREDPAWDAVDGETPPSARPD